ncbi:MAG TPA: SDR family NAD(P)-dependent oxidoreductase, partial [Myxococcota bacterium]
MSEQSKRVALVTGGNRSLGFLLATDLAKRGYHVVIAARSSKNGDEAVAKIKAADASASVEAMALDVSSLASVRAFVAAFLARGLRLDVLVNNAGIMTAADEPMHKTVDGLEATFATNHVGSALLSLLLLEKLRASTPARIVNIASRAHMGFPGMGGPAQFDFDNVDGAKGFAGVEAYKNSKLAMLWFNYELARRLPDKSVTVNAVCPGFVPETAGEHAKGFQRFLFKHVLTHVPGAHPAGEAA